MKPLPERLHDLLEQREFRQRQDGQQPNGFILPGGNPELQKLLTLAQRLQSTPQAQVNPDFANQLKRRVLRRQIELQQPKRRPSLFSLLCAHPAWSSIIGVCLLFFVLGTGVLALAAQSSSTSGPLSVIKNWETHLNVSLTNNAGDRAALDIQDAQDQLNQLAGLADISHTGAYRRALSDLDQKLSTAAQDVNQLPAGTQRTTLTDKLATLRQNALSVLRGLLPQLAFPERLATTAELANLGDTVPRLTSATLILPTHGDELATIRLTGSNLQPGAQLLLDNKLVKGAVGSIQNGQLVFIVDWHGNQNPHNLGILNPDGTVAQISQIAISGTDPNNGNDPNKNGNGVGNGNGDSKPTPDPSPTPHH